MLHGIDRRHHEFHQIPKDGAPFSGGTGMEGSVANPRLRGAVEDGEGGGVRTMWAAATRWNPSSYGTTFI
jgi:hypothetical protein